MSARYTPVDTRPTSLPWAIPRGLIVLLAVAATGISVAVARGLSGLLGPLFLALMLTIAAQPVRAWAQKRGLPSWAVVILTTTTVYAILLGLIGALALSVAQLATILPTYTGSLAEILDGARSMLGNAGVDDGRIDNLLSSIDIGKIVGYIDGLLVGLLGVVSNLAFLVTLLLFMAVDGTTISHRMHVVDRMRPDIFHALSVFVTGTRKYLLVSTVFGLIVAVIDGAALWLLGVPLPVLWALLSFITNYIPNIGFLIGLIPPALLALLEGGPILMLWVILLYCAINIVIQSIIQPKFVGDAVGLSITVTFLSLVFWTMVLGALGALLAVPLTLLVKALLIDIDPSTRWLDALIGDTPAKPELESDPIPEHVGGDDPPRNHL
ncbi:AI-2E family transporter [Dietzia sp. NPDC055877]